MIIIKLFNMNWDSSEVMGPFESIQMTGEDLRDSEDSTILHYDIESQTWFDTKTGNGWYDWTVEAEK